MRLEALFLMSATLALPWFAPSGPLLAQEAANPVGTLWHGAQAVVSTSRAFPLDSRAPAVRIEGLRSRVVLDGAVARTRLDLSLRNPGSRREDAVLLVPVPAGAAVSGVDFQGAGAEPSARLVAAAEARRLYDDIVRRARDPALLEFAGHDLLRSSVFPVEPGGTQRVRIEWEHVLPADGPRLDYVLPRSADLASAAPLDLAVEIRSETPVATVYSPTHALDVERLGPGHLRVRVAASARGEPGEFRLSVLREDAGLCGSLFAYPEAGGGGSFLFLAGASAAGRSPQTRQVTIALDRSGSMAGGKLDQARAAALQVIEGLADGERFDVVDYATTVSRFAPEAVVKDADSIRAVREYLASLRPAGGTNLHDALLEALRVPAADGALPLVLLLTDGLPTVGVRAEAAISALAAPPGPAVPRIFTFGVGADVNAPLLDRIADRTRAVATYVPEGGDIEVAVDRVARRLAGPVLSSPRLEALDDAGAVSTRRVHDVIPSALPDVFDGDHLVVLGRYRGEGELRLRLSGVREGREESAEYRFDLSRATTAHAFVPRLWASRRIAYLTDEIRQAGAEAAAGASVRTEELVAEIVRLSTEHGVLTEYTSFLATEGTDLARWGDMVLACSAELDRRAVQQRSGVPAVAQAVNFNGRKWQAALNGANRMVDENLAEVSFAAVRQVADRSFFRRGRTWIDGALAGTDAEPARRVEYGSEAHLRLLHRLALRNRQAVLSLDGDILLAVDGETVLVANPTER